MTGGPGKPASFAERIPDPSGVVASDYDRRIQEQQLRAMKLPLDMRELYASRLFWMMCCWLGGMFLLLFLVGIDLAFFRGMFRWQMKVPESVLIALVGGTTVNVLGLFYVVARHVFPPTSKPVETA